MTNKEAYKQEILQYIEDQEFFTTNDPEQAIYEIDDILIFGDFCDGIRGLDHNSLIFDNFTFQDVVNFGIVLVPETKVYISEVTIDRYEKLGYKKEF